MESTAAPLFEYDVSAAELKHFDKVVEDQSIISLVYSDKQLIGGTSIWGGLGVVPVAQEAKLFGWDPVNRKKIYEIIPVPGAKAITCLVNAPNGKIWGLAAGTLFVFDPLQRKVTGRFALFEDNRNTALWRADALLKHPSGDYYAGVNGQLYRVFPKTMTAKKLGISGSHFIINNEGSIFFSRSKDLWVYQPYVEQ